MVTFGYKLYRGGKDMRRKSYEELKQLFEAEGYTLVSDNYLDAKSKIETQCPEGHTYFVSYSNFKYNKRRCPKCVGSGVRLTLSVVKKGFEDRGYTLLETKYTNNETPMKCICDNGHTVEIPYASIKRGRGCKICAGNQPLTIEEIKSHVEGFGYTLYSTSYERNTDKIEVQCKFKHKKYKVSVMKFRRGDRCPYCHASSGERAINYLLGCMLPDTIEYTFQQPKNIASRNLRFDFYVPVGRGVYIEYQGEGHDRPIDHFGGEPSFTDLQHRDSLKREDTAREGSELCYVGYWDSNASMYNKMREVLGKYLELNSVSEEDVRRAHLYDIDVGFDLHDLLSYYKCNTATETARKFNVHEATVYRYFKDYYGETKRRYLARNKTT
jgi:hypothetical protein